MPSDTQAACKVSSYCSHHYAAVPASCSNTGTARNTPGALAANGILGIGVFDWGLPFFYGRNVYAAIEQQSTPGGVGPYFAY